MSCPSTSLGSHTMTQARRSTAQSSMSVYGQHKAMMLCHWYHLCTICKACAWHKYQPDLLCGMSDPVAWCLMLVGAPLSTEAR